MSEWSILWDARETFLDGTLNTLVIFAISVVAAFVCGCVMVFGLEVGRISGRLIRLWIDLMRMLPFLVLAYLFYYGLPAFGVRLSAWSAGLIALILYHGAYFAEILRGIRLTLPAGQIEAAKAHGFRPLPLYWRITLPQLVLKSRLLLGNQLIYALKDTAFLSILTVQELTAAGNSVQTTYFIPAEAFVVVIALYWVISIALELALKWAARFGAKRGFEHV